MTTAARPTWAPAKGGEDQGGTRMFGPGQQFSSRDLASHTRLKVRKDGQQRKEEISSRNLRSELEERERKHFKGKEMEDRKRGSIPMAIEGSARSGHPSSSRSQAAPAQPKRLAAAPLPLLPIEERLVPKAIDADDSDEEEGEGGKRGRSGEKKRTRGFSDAGDAPREAAHEEDDSEASESEGDSDDEDDTADLLAELERIKRERAEEKARKEREEADEERKAREEELARGNPLLSVGAKGSNSNPANAGLFSVKRRWDDDVVFRNQARGEAKPMKRFINDTIRSDFHRKFLNKYMK